MGPQEVCQILNQSDNIIRHFRKKYNSFSDSGALKTYKFDENFESDFSHKTNTFSYDKNVKM